MSSRERSQGTDSQRSFPIVIKRTIDARVFFIRFIFALISAPVIIRLHALYVHAQSISVPYKSEKKKTLLVFQML